MLTRPRTFLRLNISQQTLQTLAKPPTHSILPDPQHLRPPKMINRGTFLRPALSQSTASTSLLPHHSPPIPSPTRSPGLGQGAAWPPQSLRRTTGGPAHRRQTTSLKLPMFQSPAIHRPLPLIFTSLTALAFPRHTFAAAGAHPASTVVPPHTNAVAPSLALPESYSTRVQERPDQLRARLHLRLLDIAPLRFDCLKIIAPDEFDEVVFPEEFNSISGAGRGSTATLPQKKLPLPSIFRLGLYRVRIVSSISPPFSFLLPLLLDTGVANCGESSVDTTCGVGCDTHSRRAISAMSEWKKGGLGRWTVSSSLAPSSSSPSIRTVSSPSAASPRPHHTHCPASSLPSNDESGLTFLFFSDISPSFPLTVSSSHSCVLYVCTENRSLCASSTRSVSSPPFPLFPNTVDRRGVDPNRTASDPVSNCLHLPIALKQTQNDPCLFRLLRLPLPPQRRVRCRSAASNLIRRKRYQLKRLLSDRQRTPTRLVLEPRPIRHALVSNIPLPISAPRQLFSTPLQRNKVHDLSRFTLVLSVPFLPFLQSHLFRLHRPPTAQPPLSPHSPILVMLDGSRERRDGGTIVPTNGVRSPPLLLPLPSQFPHLLHTTPKSMEACGCLMLKENGSPNDGEEYNAIAFDARCASA
ncbi:hypothetical protein BLNAU_17531 [Blattamonas nauphoetae]|uniref:Uncharacterized protein n=1 Tax=Blattamonas nauphoetae TaxID=2049346 RepID=A0ABQ9X6U8_9EUKA|nr:hypothetical protein BLNAU_17531 [Blattamonas nauphoetae]